MIRKIAAGFALGSGAAALVLLLGWTGVLETAEMKTYDWRVRQAADASSVHPDIVLVELNDTTLRDFVPVAGRWPWPRVLHSTLIDYLNRGPARVIAYDVTFSEPDATLAFAFGGDKWSGSESDKALVDSVAAAGNVLMLANAVDAGAQGEQVTKPSVWRDPGYRLNEAIEERPVILPPFQGLADASAGLGHNFLAFDTDGPARRMAPFIRSRDNRYLPSLGVAAALAAAGVQPGEISMDGDTIRVRDRRLPLLRLPVRDVADPKQTHDQLTMLINYRAPALVNGRRPYPSYEVRHLLVSEGQLLSGERPLVDPSVFKDKVVFVGLTASGLLDVFATPFGEGTMPGIQLHASMADNILSNHFLTRAPNRSRLSATIAAALIVGLMSSMLPFIAAAAGTLLAISGWTWYSVTAFRGGEWVNMAEPLSAMAVALFAGTAYRYFVEGAEKRVVKRLFGRYVSRDVYDQLISHPELAELGGKRREMTVLFSDIRGFTTVTEKGDPEELVAQLNEYFSRMVTIVFDHKGTVDKFVGDMVMALFGAPLDDPDHAEHAVQAAVEMVRVLGELNLKWGAEGRTQLDIGVGISSGGMIAGNIGSSSIMSYTVIGDKVNLGARLESLNKDYKTRIIISDATRALLTGGYEIRPLGDVTVKGKTKAVSIFQVQVPSPLPIAAEEAHL